MNKYDQVNFEEQEEDKLTPFMAEIKNYIINSCENMILLQELEKFLNVE